jgi:hypothetical protein
MKIEKYLQKLQDNAGAGSISTTSSASGITARVDNFPSYKKKKKKQVLRVTYPNENVTSTKVRRAMIDLDGTIHKYSKGWSDGTIYDTPIPGAKKVIEWLKSKGFEIVIFTTRASVENAKEYGQDVSDQIQMVENWLSNNDIYYDRVTAEKLNADFYIDDKAIHIKNGNWLDVLKEIRERIKY